MAAPPRAENPSTLLLPIHEAHHRLRRLRLPTVPGRWVDVRDAVGLVNATTLRARFPEPAVDTSAMDGFAVRWPAGGDRSEFHLRPGLAAAGTPARTLAPGEAIAITTGAPLPSGAVAVVRKERALVVGDRLRVRAPLPRGTDVHYRGEDLARGDMILRAGAPVRPVHLGLLLAQGVRRVHVRVARLTFVPIGDELAPRRNPRRGTTNDTISPVIARLAPSTTSSTIRPVPDDLESIANAVRDAARSADLVVTVGGTSVGAKDFTKAAVASVGKVVIPGTRVNVLKRGGLGVVAGVPVLMLPGQVASSAAVWQEFGLELLRKLLGTPEPPTETARLARPLSNPHPMDAVYFLELRNGSAYPCRWGVRLYSVLLRAAAYVIVPKGALLAAGSTVTVRQLTFS